MKKLHTILECICTAAILPLLVAVMVGGCKKDSKEIEHNPLLGEWYLEYVMDSAKTMKIPYQSFFWGYSEVKQPHILFTRDTVFQFDYQIGKEKMFYSYSQDTLKTENNVRGIDCKITNDSLYLYGYANEMLFISCVDVGKWWFYFGMKSNYWHCVFSKRSSTPY